MSIRHVLDHGYVELQETMGSDLTIVTAARTSVLGENRGEAKDKKLLMYLAEHGHTSPFEMAEMRFRLKAPLMTWWQLVRHRTLNINMQSGRYSVFQDEFYVPTDWRLQSTTNKQGSSDEYLEPGYGKYLTHTLTAMIDSGYQAYKAALDMGVAKELARAFLPGFLVYYTGVVKCDVHNWMHFFKLRRSREAQYEIRVYAEAMYQDFKTAFPWSAEAFETYLWSDNGSENLQHQEAARSQADAGVPSANGSGQAHAGD